MKICTKCKESKIEDYFGKDKNREDGLNLWCKECISLYYELNKEKRKNYYKENKEKINNNSLKYRQNNKEKVKTYSDIYRQNNKEKINSYYRNNKEKFSKPKTKTKPKTRPKIKSISNNEKKIRVRDYKRNRYNNDLLFKLKSVMRRKINGCIFNKNIIKNSRTVEILGCSYEEFKLYLESKFVDWMSWDNYGNPKDGILEPNKTWDIDHIIPISSAKTEEEIYKLNHYSNLQPLCSYINRIIKKDNL